MRMLFVLDSYLQPDKIDIKRIHTQDEVYLFPLTSKTFIALSVLERIQSMGCSVEVLQTADIINTAANRLRDQYIRFIAELPERVQDKGRNLKELFALDEHATLWWFSLISEKNTFKSDSLNRLIQLEAIIDTIKHHNIDKVFFGCRCEKLKNALSEYTNKNSTRFETLKTRKLRGIKRRISELQKLLYLKHVFLLLHATVSFLWESWKIKKRFVNLTRKIPVDQKPLLIITYYPNFDINLAQKGIFKNKYYVQLQEAVTREGENIVWIAMYVQHSSLSFEESLDYAERFIKNHYPFFFLKEFSTIRMQVKAILVMLWNGLKFLKIEKNISRMHNFDGYNFYSILKDDWYSSFVGNVGYSGVLYYYMFKALLSKTQAKRCLYFCEMHAWEKALVFAKQATKNRILLFGYQHATVSKMLLNYFNDSIEIVNRKKYGLPLPNKILCNGQLSLQYMKESGWPEEKLAFVEAIRYNHLKNLITTVWNKKKNTVLVGFSINPEESSAILNIVCEALVDLREIEIWIKPHPFLDIKRVFELAEINEKKLPFKIKYRPVEELFPKAKIVIVGESGVSLEALACGCRVVVANVPEMLNMSPLKYVKSHLVETVNSPQELRQKILSIFNEEYTLETYAKEAKRILNDFFYFNYDSNIPERFMKVLKRAEV